MAAKPHPLKVARELRGWSQARVAEAVGTNVRTVIRWEQGQTLPYPYYRERLCALFGKNARELGLLEGAEEYADAADYEQISNHQAVPQSSPMPDQFWRVPSPLLPLIGRTQEMQEIQDLIASVRLLTLVGAGGIGKTRLSIQLAHALRPHFPDGICFVSLTVTRDPEQVMSLIARALELQGDSGSPYEWVQEFLGEKAWLLVLDNFEQVIPAAPELERLLANCRRVRILVTSRAILHLPSEYQYRLLPLAVPNLKRRLDMATVAHSPAVQLFLQRARTFLPAFHVTQSNAATLANICERLDGLPLAIELAAARIRLLPPHDLLPRLTRSLHVLTSGLPALPERQQTLRNTLQWSYDLLDAETQRFFRHLSLFVGGFTVDAAEALFAGVMGENHSRLSSALDGLDALIDHSLLQPAIPTDEGEESRLQMLETIREFGMELLLESGDMERAQAAHATYYLQLAEKAAAEMSGPHQGTWLDRLDQEHGNLQTAMEWMLAPADQKAAEEHADGKPALALRLGNTLCRFWIVRGYQSEGWRFIEQALQANEMRNTEATPSLAQAYLVAASLSARLGNLEHAALRAEQGVTCTGTLQNHSQMAEALRMAGWIAHQRGQDAYALDCYERSLALTKAQDDQKGIAATLHHMAYLLQTRGDYQKAHALLEEEITWQRAVHNTMGIFGALYQLAWGLFRAEEYPPLDRIHALVQEGLTLAQEARDRRGVAGMQGLLGWVVSAEGNLDEARALVEECLRFYRDGDRDFYGQYLGTLGEILTAQGEYGAAQSAFEECMEIGKLLGTKSEVIADALEGMASLAPMLGHHLWAVRLWAKAEQRREEIGVPLMARLRPARERSLDQLRSFLGEMVYTDLWKEGRALSLDDVWSARHMPPLRQQGGGGVPTD
jgi:predicted ATPase/DNA-binding XRE family transcriptional regulator